jgi:hypothetical protein
MFPKNKEGVIIVESERKKYGRIRMVRTKKNG